MKLVNKIFEEIHTARMILQSKRPEPVKLAIYIRTETWVKLCRELHIDKYTTTGISLSSMLPHIKDHIMGYPCYEACNIDHPRWSIVEIFSES